jgi:hypothetical protein
MKKEIEEIYFKTVYSFLTDATEAWLQMPLSLIPEKLIHTPRVGFFSGKALE